MDNRDIVFDLYKILEHAIRRRVPEYPKGKSAIWLYCQTLPSGKSGILDHIREYRNQNQGHGVGPGCMPAPEWIPFLKKEIKLIDNAGPTLDKQLKDAMERSAKKTGPVGEQAKKKPLDTVHKAPNQKPQEGRNPIGRSPSGHNNQVSAPTHQGKIADSLLYTDKEHNFSAEIRIQKGEGRITKKAFLSSTKTQFVDFVVYFSYSGKMKGYEAVLLTKNGPKEIKLKKGENRFQIPVQEIDSHKIKVKVSFSYSIGHRSTKENAMTVGRNV
jgi:hypothetical protein